jgi:hypothetical protein
MMRIEDNGAGGCGGVTFFQYFEIINGWACKCKFMIIKGSA